MRIKKSLFLLYLFFFPITISVYPRSLISTSIRDSFPRISSPDYGVSNYNITQNVKYNVEINFTLTHKSGPGHYFFKFARLNDRMPNSTLTQFTPPYQESDLLYNNITGYSTLNMGHNDKFKNTFDSFNATLGIEEKVTLSQHYVIRLNDVNFPDIDIADIGTYNTSDEMFDLYCNKSEPYYERDNSDLENLSNNLVNPADNPIQKAQKIFMYVSTTLEYIDDLPSQEMGAFWANNHSKGDCSEYSSLMVTLLRIQGIPARKVTGFVVDNDLAFRPQVGYSRNFYVTESDSDILGHAWVEYYVPDIGWIACDPTWKSNYFNSIDFYHFNLNVGANFFFPPNNNVSEFINPIFYSTSGTFTYRYDINITAIEVNLLPLAEFPFMFLIFIGIGVTAILLTIILLVKRSRKKPYHEYIL
jgi:hypothetical protein